MKRSMLALLLIVALLVAACGGGAATAPAGEVAAPAAAESNAAAANAGGDKVAIKLWSHQNNSFNQANQAIIDKFMAQHPEIVVSYETFPYNVYIQTLQTSFPAGTAADVIEIFGSWACRYAKGGQLAPVPDEVMSYDQAKELFFQAPLDGYYCDGKLYGLPNEFNLENGGALVNEELFTQANRPFPPKWVTFADLVTDAKAMTVKEGDVVTRPGFHYIGGDQLPFALIAGILQQDGKYFADDGLHFNFDTPEAKNMIQLLVDLAQKDQLIDPITFNNDSQPPLDAFGSQLTPITFIGSWGGGEIKATRPEVKFDYVTVPPYFGTVNKFAADSGWGKVVPASSKHPNEAWMLAQFMVAEQENAEIFNGTTGTIPALKSIIANPDNLLEKAPWIRATIDLLPNGQYLGWLTDRDQLFYTIIYEHVLTAIQGDISVDEAAKLITDDANAMVDSAGQ